MAFDRDQWKKNSGKLDGEFSRVAQALQDERAKVADLQARFDALDAKYRSRLHVAKQRMNDHALRIARLARRSSVNNADADATLTYLDTVVEDVRAICGDFDAEVAHSKIKTDALPAESNGKPFLILITRDLMELSDHLRVRALDLKDEDLCPEFLGFPPQET